MKASVIGASFLATLALSKPLDKRALVTSWDLETVTVTVTGSAGGRGWADWGEWSATPTAAVETTFVPAAPSVEATSPAVAPEPTTAPAPAASSWSPPAVAVVSGPAGSWSRPAMETPPSAPRPSAPSSSAPAPTQDTSGLSDYAAPLLTQHNIHRQNHSAAALTWDDNLAAIAAQIASSCVYAHDTSAGGGGYGQNIGAGAPPEDAPKMITNQMYNGEIEAYPGYGGEPDMGNFEVWGHFSQIVWASTTSVGCATQHCPNGLANTGSGVSPYFTVCNYSPPGNFGGQYGKNVLAPKGGATVIV